MDSPPRRRGDSPVRRRGESPSRRGETPPRRRPALLLEGAPLHLLLHDVDPPVRIRGSPIRRRSPLPPRRRSPPRRIRSPPRRSPVRSVARSPVRRPALVSGQGQFTEEGPSSTWKAWEIVFLSDSPSPRKLPAENIKKSQPKKALEGKKQQ
ncbi:hypothetical protein MLD38_027058 [Melastoma candidum]|uniref:Uncharacterized protein n=1 Tax=Melastoma candidum TaxID=119954 RepID=A0ACB9P3W8_9MYRT|nr:hypothetical protein MLD38_027058 [Melastoma candidum]